MRHPVDSRALDVALRLGELLRATGYNREAIRDVFGPIEPLTSSNSRTVRRLRCAGADTRSILIRLFYLGMRERRGPAASALASVGLPDLEAAGFTRSDGEEIIPQVQIVPSRG